MTERQPGEADQLVSEVADQLAKQRAAISAREAASTPGRRRGWAAAIGLAVTLPVLVVLIVPPLTGRSLSSLVTPGPPPAVARARAQQMLDTLVADIESFKEDYEELPETLAEVGMPPEGTWRYEVGSGGSYTIEGTLHGQRVRFDSAP